jgi:Asp-tRNA(Asn)/Glu-tRNA(Gln) amidotransferase A subunit family amidase
MAELMRDYDMYVPGGGTGAGQYDIGLHAQTGHPCVVVPYKFDSPPPPFGARTDSTATPTTYNQQPICAVLAGNLYEDDRILSVAHVFQASTDWHRRHPTL